MITFHIVVVVAAHALHRKTRCGGNTPLVDPRRSRPKADMNAAAKARD